MRKKVRHGRRIISVLLTLVMALSAVPFQVFAEDIGKTVTTVTSGGQTKNGNSGEKADHEHTYENGSCTVCGEPCAHRDADGTTGACVDCGAACAAKIIAADGTVHCTEELKDADFDGGSTIILLKDAADSQYAPPGSCTIDLNGHSIGFVSFLTDGAVLTLKGSGTVGSITLGYMEAAAALVINEENGGKITVKRLWVNRTDNTKLTGGTFSYIEIKQSNLSIAGIVADGYSVYDESISRFMYTGNFNVLRGNYYIGRHDHSFTVDENGGVKCACGFYCGHGDGNKDSRRAGYFLKAYCATCGTEYGECLKDVTPPTGKITVKDRTWWQSILNAVSFGLFYAETVKADITAVDDSYQHPGFDAAKHSVRVEYFISDTVLTEKEVIASEFTAYTGEIDLSDERQYIIYVRVTDWAGNVSYASTEGFEIDTTMPAVEVISPVNMLLTSETTVYPFCADKLVFRIVEKNLSVMVTSRPGNVATDDDGNYVLAYKEGDNRLTIRLIDSAGNERKIKVVLNAAHDFDEDNKCRNCGAQAVAKADNSSISELFTDGDGLFAALSDEKYSGATVTFLSDVNVTERIELSNRLIIDLNGYTLQKSGSAAAVLRSGAHITFRSSVEDGNVGATIGMPEDDSSLTFENGIGSVVGVVTAKGSVTIYGGRYTTLLCSGKNIADRINLYGGSYIGISVAGTGMTCGMVLGNGFRFREVNFDEAGERNLNGVSVIPCRHAEVDENNVCTGCGRARVVSVGYGGVSELFDSFDDAVHCAEKNDGSVVRLYQDVTLDSGSALSGDGVIGFEKGIYTIDLGGKTLTLTGSDITGAAIKPGCDLTLTDTVGGGKVKSGTGHENLCVSAGGRLTVTGGDFTALAEIVIYGADSLVLKGGSFKRLRTVGSGGSELHPVNYLADGFALKLGDRYAGEGDGGYMDGNESSRWIDDVTVVKAPLEITTQPRDVFIYTNAPLRMRSDVYVMAAYHADLSDTEKVTATLVKADGTQMAQTALAVSASMTFALDTDGFKDGGSGQYRVRLEFRGYVIYSDIITITVTVCDHRCTFEDMIYGYRCPVCHTNIRALIYSGENVTCFTDEKEAFAAAQTEENRGKTLRLLYDVADNLTVKSGSFTLEILSTRTVSGNISVAKGAELSISGSASAISGTVYVSTVSGKVICAAGGKLSASMVSFTGTVNCTGEAGFTDCGFNGAVSGRSVLTAKNCALKSTLSVSGTAYLTGNTTVSGLISVNNGGTLNLEPGIYSNVKAKSGSKVNIYPGASVGTVTAESGSVLHAEGGNINSVSAKSGSTFTTVNQPWFGDAAIEENVNITLYAGAGFGKITVNGKKIMECLGDGLAFRDNGTGEIIDGRVGIASDVTVVEHTHTCIWKTSTHEKLCGCGYVEETDNVAPVITGITDGSVYYGSKGFAVSDANGFTVTIDGTAATDSPVTSFTHTFEPDNKTHTVTATDIAGNSVSVTVSVMKLYTVTLPTGIGYTVTGKALAGHGTDYTFEIRISEGYSKTKNYRVLVNGSEIYGMMGDETYDVFMITGVSGDMTVTVEGVADITPPAAEIVIGTNRFNSFMNSVTFGMFFKKTQTVTVTAGDTGSGLKSVEYLLSESVFADIDAVTGVWTPVAVTGGKAEFDIEPVRKAYVYIRATDNSGNIQVINSSGVVIYTDSEAVTGAIDFTMLGTDDVSFDVKLNGNTVSALYNGGSLIDSGYYTVSADGRITLKNAYLKALAAGEYTIRTAYDPMSESYAEGDAPAMTSVRLNVNRAEPILAVTGSGTEKEYDGKPAGTPGYVTGSDGKVTVEYKPSGADDSAYTTEAPKDAGEYTFRITVAETGTYKQASVTGTCRILKKKVTLTGTSVEPSKVYDGTTGAKIIFPGAVTGLIDGDDVSVVTGKANYSDRNAGTAKTVIFTGFALSGEDAKNYELSAQPENTSADITAKELMISGLAVGNKYYDGTNTAKIVGIPTLVGLADGDRLQLLDGIPTFDSVSVGKDIPVSFTKFSLFGDSTLLCNYTLKQPSGITADILEYKADGGEYSVNSNGWINTDFTVTAKDGYLLSLTVAVDGEWTETLTASDETADGSLTFYVKNTATGAISSAVTERYKIDRTAPTGEVSLNGRSAFQTVLSRITFGLFFRDAVSVRLTADDDASGVKSVGYYKSDRALTDEEVRNLTGWTDNSDFGIAAEDRDRFIIYVRIEDNAGNVGYIGSDGATFDTTAPVISGVENGRTYYVTKKVTVIDENLESVTLDGEPVSTTEFILPGDTDAIYVIRATDKAGNVTEYTVTMKPILSITDVISEITADNVKSAIPERYQR